MTIENAGREGSTSASNSPLCIQAAYHFSSIASGE